MRQHIPRVTIYRMSKYEPEKSMNSIDLMLQFRNPNDSVATLAFLPLTAEQLEEQKDKIIVQTQMPVGEIVVDPPEIYQEKEINPVQEPADSATTNVKAQVAKNPEDQQYVYKKADNCVVLILKMVVPQGFNFEKQDLYFGFQMTT